VKKIKKRDGRIAEFNQEKIVHAIFKAAISVGGQDYHMAQTIANKVTEEIEKAIHSNELPDVETVQDYVEKVLIETGHARTAKAYILYRADEKAALV